MNKKNLTFGGLDLRSKDINQTPDKSSFLFDVELDSRGDLRSRNEIVEEATIPDSLRLNHYKKGDELLYLHPTGLRKITGVSYDGIVYAGQSPIANWSGAPSFAEYNGAVYWTDEGANNELHKYDGRYVYRAGCPQPVITGLPATVTVGDLRYVRIWFSVKDLQGNETFGDYVQLGPWDLGTLDQLDFTIDTMTTAETRGFPDKSFEPAIPSQTIGGGNAVITLIASGASNYIVNDFIYCYTANNGIIPVKVTGTTTTTITVDTTPLDDLGITHAFTNSFVVGGLPGLLRASKYTGLVTIYYGVSDNPQGPYDVGNIGTLLTHRGASYAADIPLVRVGGIAEMEEIYDTLIVKGLPPKSRYCSLYNNILVLGSANTDSQDIEDGISLSVEDTMFWSDLSVGSTVETFAPFDREQIGGTDEGGITGFFGNQDTLTVFKERQVYFIQGVLTGGNFRVRNGRTTEIGCVSHQSIYEYRGGCIFMSNRGIYYTRNGGDPIEISDIIEPMFTGDPNKYDLTQSKAALDQYNEKLYMFIPGKTTPGNDIVLVYDYYWKEWFLHSGFHAHGGLLVKDDILLHAESDITGKLYNSTGSAGVDGAYWVSSWITAGEPGIFKKYLNILLWSASTPNWDIRIRVQKNWDDATDILDTTKTFTDKDLKIDLPAHDVKSIRILISGMTVADRLSGFELEYENISTRHKG